MLILLSPSKTLDYSSDTKTIISTQPEFISDSKLLINKLKTLNSREIAKLMDISEKLSELNYNRFQNFPYNYVKSTGTKQAIYCFKGDVYTDIDVTNYTKQQLEFTQQHVRILSGLYGILKPLDMLYPYRLEMGTNTKSLIGCSLYDFWSDKITKYLNDTDNKAIINLASSEYFDTINVQKLKSKLINIVFKENHKGSYKVIGIHAKKARGTMTNWIVKNSITNPEKIKDFNINHYKFSESMSDDNNYVFLR